MDSILQFILSLVTVLSGAGWIVERRKRNAENKKAELDVSVSYVKEFYQNIVIPLKEELALFRSAVQIISACPRYPDCPVLRELNFPDQPPAHSSNP